MSRKLEFPEQLFPENTGEEPADAQATSSGSNDSLVFVGFNSRVVALDRRTGQLVWDWKSPKGSGFVAVLLDADRLIVSVQGYTYCLDPNNGALLWANPLSGLGVGIPCLASAHGSTLAWSNLAQIAADLEQAQQQQHSQMQQQQIVHQHH
ncbi:MAG: PQQ-binding-like beta-propeller repeat protein [Planctomycetaceae bacterium]